MGDQNHQDKFFNQTNCDRCTKELNGARTTSWFTEETICMDCSDEETELKKQIRGVGMNPDHFEGCGFIPELETI